MDSLKPDAIDTPPVSTARNSQLDVARGLGILLVVLGHSGVVNTVHGEPYEAIYSFHVPLFFVLAGIFFKAEAGFWQFAVSRADRLLKPYVATLLIFSWGIVGELPWTPVNYAIATLFGSGRMMPIGPLWFLPHLFLLSLVAWMLLRNGRILALRRITQLIAVGGLLVVGGCCLRWGSALTIGGLSFGMVHGDLAERTPGLPYGADLLGVTLAYFLLGLFARSYILQRSRSAAFTVAAVIVFVAIHLLTDVTMDINARRYDHILLSTLSALAGAQMVFGLAGSALADSIPGRVLAYFGRHSLVVLCFHFPISLFVSRHLDTLGWSANQVDATTLAVTIGICAVVAVIVSRSPLRWLYEPIGKSGIAAAPTSGLSHATRPGR